MIDNIEIIKASISHIDEIERLYNDLNIALESGINYAGWKLGIYPIRETAIKGIEEDNLYILKCNDEIAGSIILNNEPEKAYYNAKWQIDADYNEVLVVHTFVVHPKYSRLGIGKRLMDFAEDVARELKMKSIRLDTYDENMPASKLYEKCGYNFIGKVDLGYGEYGLDWFKLYEKIM